MRAAGGVSVGALLGGFRVEELVARGGMGVVYRATQLSLERSVALKVVAPELSADARFRERFLREARLSASLEHPHLLPVYEAGEADGVVFVAMKLVEGISLADLLARDGRLAASRAVALVTQVAGALELAHAAGLVHRDVKPANVLLTQVGGAEHAYLCDFGLSRRVAGGTALTRPEGFVGSAAYAAPEQIRGAEVDGRADIYALGCVLFECLTGNRPFERDDELALMWAHMHEPAPLPSATDSALAPFDTVIARVLAKEPSERFQSAVELAAALAAPRAQPAVGMQITRPAFSASNLPVPATSFLGRQRELAAVLELLGRDDVHLLTLTGPGGIGKTRLALEVATEAVDTYSQGACWVSLAPVREPDLVYSAIAEARGVPEVPGPSLLDSLALALAGKTLLVLDNAEHLLPELGHRLNELRGICPELTVMVTSRERLQLEGEHMYAVPSLSPDEGLALFLARALALGSRDGPSEALHELCARLDHLPLALELAAARTVVLTPNQLLERLGQRLDLLKGGRDADPRQQTLRTTIDWSYRLLTSEERRALRAMSVFAGGCSLDAAEEVADVDIDTVQSLIDKSLLRRQEGSEGARFWMLETIREFAVEQLTHEGELAAVEKRHIDWCLEYADGFEGSNYRRITANDIARFRSERANLRAATRRAIDSGDVDAALRLVAALGAVWFSVGAYESLRDAEEALALPGWDEELRADALVAAVFFSSHWDPHSRQEGGVRLGEAERHFERTGDLRGQAAVEMGLGILRHLEEDNEEAGRRLERAYELATTAPDAELAMLTKANLAAILSTAGDRVSLRRAATLFEELLDDPRQEPLNRQVSLGNLAQASVGLGDFATAIRHGVESLRLAVAIGLPYFWVLIVLARALFGLERPKEGSQLIGLLRRQLEAEHYELSVTELKEIDDFEAIARAAVGPDEFARAIRDGESMEVADLDAETILSEVLRARRDADDAFARTATRSNLPTPATPLVGRSAEISDVVSLLRRDDVRLLTLTGPGGTGKTRLAVQAADDVSAGFPDGVWWVPLAPLRDASLVVSAVAQVLGVKEQPGRELLDVLSEWLADKRLLLVLDNAEHLLPDVAVTASRLHSSGTSFMLVTSRERMQVAGEHVFPVPELDPTEAVELFLARASATGANVEGSPTVVELCARLEQLPLALELAAARTVVFSPEQLLARLSQRLDLFKGGRDSDPRQQTLRATIEWSYDLLDETEQRLLRRLSVFAGGCTYDAAEQVAAADPDTLQSLLEKSLLRRRDEPGRETRYWMLETIREFAAEHPDSGTALRHALYFTALAESAFPTREADDVAAIELLTPEQGNLRRALSVLEDAGSDGFLRLAAALGRYWYWAGELAEGDGWLDAALALPSDSPGVRAKAFHWHSAVLESMGRYDAARDAAIASVELYRALASEELPFALQQQASVLSNLGQFAASEALLEESLSVRHGDEDAILVASTLVNMAALSNTRHEFERTGKLIERALPYVDRIGIPQLRCIALQNWGSAYVGSGAYSEATPLLRESLLLASSISTPDLGAGCLATTARLIVVDQPSRAAHLVGAVEALLETHGLMLQRLEREFFESTVSSLEGDSERASLAEERLRGREITLRQALDYALASID